MVVDPRLHRIVAEQPYPLLFATISGAHLYGFPSPDSDFDLRGAHVLPLEKVVGLDVRDETVAQQMRVAPHPGPLPIGCGDLVARKLTGPEKSKLKDTDIAFHEKEYHRLRGVLQTSHDASGLPERPNERTRGVLNDLLVRVRTKGLATAE
jgi:predicted nucleotidyltransferase